MENGIRPPIQMAVDNMRNLCLGYTGEQNAQLIQIDVSKWQEKWPGASIDLMLALPGEKSSYPAKTELQDGKLLFLPGYGDTQKPGHGAAYVVATKDGTHLAASDTVLTEIMHKGRGGDELPEAPEAQAGWVADVLDAAHRAEEAAKRAENAQVTDEQVGKAVEDYLQENPVEAPVQSVNGKTGTVQLSATDVGALPKDTPIPAPYTLPTASADTKGGVKVGKGLRMDGDVMGVVEPGYEKMASVTIGTGGASEITFPDVSNLSAVMACLTMPVSDKVIGTFLQVITDKGTDYVVGSNYGSVNGRHSIRMEMRIDRGILTGTTQGNTYGWGSAEMKGINNAGKVLYADSITKVHIYCPQSDRNILEGTVIEIYGVRV